MAPTTALTGGALEPVLTATSAAQAAGSAGHDHITVIRQFWDRLPRAIDIQTRMAAEGRLAELAGVLRPDERARPQIVFWPISTPMAASPATLTGLGVGGSVWGARARIS